MESYPMNNMNNELPRLASFHKYPLLSPEGSSRQNQLYVSPLKLARAGFHRENGLASDEVVCFSCYLKVKDWNGESPMAVHRILSPDCQFLKQIYNTPSRPMLSVGVLSSGGTPTPAVRRQLFPENARAHVDSTLTERMSILSFEDPFSCHAVENDLLLFENHRLLTFVNPLDSLSQAWAKEGFVADLSERDLMVKCVFCGEKTSFGAGPPCEIHEEISPNCPLVRYLDVGNISRELEEKVKRKYGGEPHQQTGAFHRHPQFQELQKRLETFQTWPYLLENILPKQTLAEAGFFFSGCSDKVECYSCGIGLRNWRPGADPWRQHARVWPSCLHLTQHADPEHLQGAADCEILCDADPPTEGPLSCEGEVRSSSPVLPQLSLEAVQAALACGYQLEAVRQAVRSIFLATRGYPNFALLEGRLQASEANFGLLQKQSSQIQHCHTQIQQHEQELEQERHIHMQERDFYQQEVQTVQTALLQERLQVREKERQCQRMRRELAAKAAALEWQRTEVWRLAGELQGERSLRAQSLQQQADSVQHLVEEIARQDLELSSKDQQLSRKDQQHQQQLSRKDQQLSRKDQQHQQQLSRKDQQLSRKDQLIEKLAELLQQSGMELPPLDLDASERVVPLDEDALPPLPPSPPPSPPPPQADSEVPAFPPVSPPASPPAFPPASPGEGEGVPQDLLCKVCLHEEARALFQPCRHLCCGPRCAQRLSGQGCPVCRTRISAWTLVFRA